jgi:hypothetical protein
MKLVGYPDDGHMMFECPTCGAVAVVLRCTGVSAVTGLRCRSAAKMASDRCHRHDTPAVSA